MFFSRLIPGALCALPAVFSLPHDKEHQPEMNTLSSYYTLTVYKPHDDKLNALKVESTLAALVFTKLLRHRTARVW